MLSFYLFCLVLGGGFAILSAFGDLFDSGADLQLDAEVDLDGGERVDAAETPPDVGRAAAIFSLRSLIYSMFGFGAAGSLLTALGAGPGAPLTLGFSVLAGLLFGSTLGSVLVFLKRLGRRARSGDGESKSSQEER